MGHVSRRCDAEARTEHDAVRRLAGRRKFCPEWRPNSLQTRVPVPSTNVLPPQTSSAFRVAPVVARRRAALVLVALMAALSGCSSDGGGKGSEADAGDDAGSL